MSKKPIVLLCCLLIGMLTIGCGQKTTTTTSVTNEGEEPAIKVVSTIFPGYDFARQVVGEDGEVTMLLSPGAESHSYEPTPQDILMIQNCDLFIYGGGEGDQWVERILNSMDQPVNTLAMIDCVAVVEEEIKEGMEHEHDDEHHDDHDHDHDHDDEEHDHHGEAVYDEHVWTSQVNAIAIVDAITAKVCEVNGEQASDYEYRAQQYIEQIAQLHIQFADVLAVAKEKTLVFGDRFPFRYFVDAYGLDYFAAFPGCSTESEPSAATIAFLIDKVKAENLSTVFYIELSTP